MAVNVLGLLVCVTAFTGSLAGPGIHKHMAHAEGAHEEFRIVARTTSGSGADPNWIVDNDTTNKNIKTILKVLREMGHSKAHNTVELPSLSGYRGLEIRHVTATENHLFNIPRCKLPKLQYLLINLTSGNAVSPGKKEHVYKVLGDCIKAAAAKKTRETSARETSAKEPATTV